MPDNERFKAVEIRSEEVQEILGRPPSWIIRWGITVFFVIILILLWCSWFIKYPEIISADITFNTQNPPVFVSSKSSGRIINIFINDNSFVKKNQIIFVIENSAETNHVLKLDSLVSQFKSDEPITNYSKLFEGCDTLNLGEISDAYFSFYFKWQEFTLKEETNSLQIKYTLKQLFIILSQKIKQWKQNYAVVSPVEGKVFYNGLWNINQVTKAGDNIIQVIPGLAEEIIGVLSLPASYLNKVKHGQDVNIKLFNFPFTEYGMLKGKVNKILSVPNNNKYIVEVKLSKGLVTNFGTRIDYLPQMNGTAEIITGDLSLLQRILTPIVSLFNKK